VLQYIDSLTAKYTATNVTKNKLSYALDIIDGYIELDKDDSAQIWFTRISPLRTLSKPTDQDYFFQSLQTELYYFSDLLSLAEQSSKEAIKLANKLNNKLFLADAYFYKGLILQSNGKTDDALANLLKASKHNPDSFNRAQLKYICMPAHIYNNIAEVYNSKAMWDSAVYYNNQASNQLALNHIDRVAALIENDRACMFYATNLPDSALMHYEQVLAICQLEHWDDIPLLAYVGQAKCMLHKGNKQAAIKALEQGLQQLNKNVNSYYKRIFYEEAIPLYKACDDKIGALAMYEKLQVLNVQTNTANNKQLLTIYQNTTDNKNKLLETTLIAAQQKQRNAQFQILFLLLLLASGLVSFILYRKRVLLSAKLKSVKTDIGRDLHDEMGGAISSIKMYSGLMQQTIGSPEQVRQYNSKIEQLATEIGQKLNTIIWSMDDAKNTIDSLADRLNQYGNAFFEDSAIEFHFSQTNCLNNQEHISGVKRKNIFLVCKEALNNTAKHAQASESWLYFSFIDKTISIQIIDNGHGITHENYFANGLNNMKMRIEEIGGTIQWDNNKGTVIKILCNV
jgi:signal transduction histidine kinase